MKRAECKKTQPISLELRKQIMNYLIERGFEDMALNSEKNPIKSILAVKETEDIQMVIEITPRVWGVRIHREPFVQCIIPWMVLEDFEKFKMILENSYFLTEYFPQFLQSNPPK